MSNARVTPSMIFYGVFAAAGAVIPWYFNIKPVRLLPLHGPSRPVRQHVHS